MALTVVPFVIQTEKKKAPWKSVCVCVHVVLVSVTQGRRREEGV